jgi:hypothetical protein
MLDTILLGKLAAQLYKKAVAYQRARAGRTAKGPQMQKQLQAAGSPRMNTPGVFAYPRGQSI